MTHRPGLAALMLLPFAVAAQAPALRLERTIGVGSGVSFGEIAHGALQSDGGVVLFDARNQRVYRFSATGALRDSLGRKGGGPGEFRTVTALAVMPNGEVVLADAGKAALVRWSATGAVLPETSVRPFMLGLHAVESDLFIKSHDWRTDSIRLYRMPPGGPTPSQPTSIFLPPIDPVTRLRTSTPTGAFHIMDDGRMLVASADTLYLVTELDGTGRAAQRWARPSYPVIRWTAAERARIDQMAKAVAAEQGRPAPVTDERTFSTKPTIPFGGLGVDAAGRVWVLPRAPYGQPRSVDVFGADGRLLQSHRLPGDPSQMVVRGDRLLVWGVDEADEPAAWVYRIGAP